MSTAVRIHHEYRSLPVVRLQESPTNLRRRFDEHSLAELAAYVPAHNRRFVSLVILWPRTPNGAQELVVPAPKDT